MTTKGDITIDKILTPEKKQKYKHEWNTFAGRYKPNSSYNVHSGNPVISEIYRFEDTNIFRAHVFSKRLRKHDPYQIADKYLQSFWHAQHYLTVCEQIYTASTKLIVGDEYNGLIAKDIPVNFSWKKVLFWDDNVSVELIKEDLGKKDGRDIQKGSFTFYSDKSGSVLSTMSAVSFLEQRAYFKDLIKLTDGDDSVLEGLIRKIRHQAIVHSQLNKPRNTLLATPEYLIDELNKGRIPKKELRDFFSLWDK
jgi:hypothetical protein